MGIKQLEHYNIRTSDLDKTVSFYTDVLGMRHGESPKVAVADKIAWIYDERDIPVVHIVLVENEEGHHKLDAYYDKSPCPSYHGSAAVDHVAFEGDNYSEMRARLVDRGVKFVEREIADLNLRQIFIQDPNDITLELNFRG